MSDSLLSDSILDSTTAFICVLDADGKIVSVSSRLARLMCGKSRESLEGLVASETVQGSAELKAFFLNFVPAAGSPTIPEQCVQPVYRNAEKPLWIKFDISRVGLPGSGKGHFITGTDITAEVLEARETAQKAHERSGFIVRMGHELRTPLNTVIGYAQLLQGLDNLSPVAREYVATIIANENSLLHLLNDVLELSKYEAGQTQPILAPVNVRKLVQEVTESFIDQFDAKYLSLSVDFKSELCDTLLTDAQKVTQVISNIIGNALKFTRKGGVSVTVSCGKLVTVDIEDTGIGIESADAPHVFEIFEQTGSSREHMTGSGIGLAVARIFARMLGGDVTLVRTDIGKGCLFRFTFEAKPIASVKKNVQTVTDYTAIKGISKPCRVLLVDDVDINLAMLEIFLAPAGFDVNIAADGNEAVEKFKSFKPDIVFMDLIMPEKDGFEATREIKAIDATVPVIALTASIVDSIKEQALEAGVNDFMNKPFVPERFFEIIAEHTGITYKT